MNTIFKACFFFLSFLLMTSAIEAQTITGYVQDQTTGKPSAGDDVILLRLAEGMQEEARTRTDSNGAFALNVTSSNSQHLVRVLHQGVNYDFPVTNTTPLQVMVYDAVRTVPGLKGNIGMVQMESDGKTLKVLEMYVVTNASNPPVTQFKPDNLDISVPHQAAFDSVEVKGPGGIWVNVTPSPVQGQQGKYRINFPLRPGDTLCKFAYHMPYSGLMTFHLRLPYPIRNFAIMHPPSMSFKALAPGTFMSPGVVQGFQLEKVVASTVVGEVPAFVISGIGAAPPPPVAESEPPAASARSTTASGHSPAESTATAVAPVDQPRRALWFLVPGIVIVLAVCVFAFWRAKRNVAGNVVPAPATGEPVLDALKEELFRLESDRLHGSVSAEEYAAARDALNQNIARVLARKKTADPSIPRSGI